MNKAILKTLLFIPLIFSCNIKKDHKVNDNNTGILTIQDAFKTKSASDTIFLSDLANDIQYIKLETTPEALISGDWASVKIINNYIFFCQNWILCQFDINGKFIRKINTTGKGPNEYMVRVFTINEKDKKIITYGHYSGRFYFYDFNGNILNSFKMEYNNYYINNPLGELNVNKKINALVLFLVF